MSKVARIGEEGTVSIYPVEETEKTIEKPTSSELLAQLQAKLEEYKERIEEKEKGWGWTIDAAYKAMILESLLNLPEGGKITLDEMDSKAWIKLVNGKMNVAGITHIEFLPKAWLVIYLYIHKQPEDIVGGTGLPKVA